jgi:hypothetical protein
MVFIAEATPALAGVIACAGSSGATISATVNAAVAPTNNRINLMVALPLPSLFEIDYQRR